MEAKTEYDVFMSASFSKTNEDELTQIKRLFIGFQVIYSRSFVLQQNSTKDIIVNL